MNLKHWIVLGSIALLAAIGPTMADAKSAKPHHAQKTQAMKPAESEPLDPDWHASFTLHPTHAVACDVTLNSDGSVTVDAIDYGSGLFQSVTIMNGQAVEGSHAPLGHMVSAHEADKKHLSVGEYDVFFVRCRAAALRQFSPETKARFAGYWGIDSR